MGVNVSIQRYARDYELISTMGALMEIEAGVISMGLAPQEIVTAESPLMVIFPTDACMVMLPRSAVSEMLPMAAVVEMFPCCEVCEISCATVMDRLPA